MGKLNYLFNEKIYFGLGFCPADNLQIDLLEFLGGYGYEENLLDADFYKQLRISFTLKF